MDTWHEYVCLDCGYGGITRAPEKYRRGRLVCPRCGSFRFTVQEADLAPLPDEYDLLPEMEE